MNESLPQTAAVTIVANDIGGVGGMERQLTELITGLLDTGARVTVISWTCDLPDHPNMRWHRVRGPSRPFAIAYPWFLLLASLLVRFHSRGIVHSTGAIILNRTDVCTVHYCHRAVAKLPGFSRASRDGIAYRLNERITKLMSHRVEEWCYRPERAQRLVGVSIGVARELRENYPRMRDRIMVIPNGVDTDAFHPARNPEPRTHPDCLQALFVGSEWERKGLPVAIEALADNLGVGLTVVGEGDVEVHRRLAKDLGVEDRVNFAGSSADVASWFRRADAFVLPTAYETFSLVTYEAAASGLPLLVTRVNGVEDLLRDGENGWFIERDATDLRDHLKSLRTDPILRRSMGEAARRDSLEYSWARVVERYREALPRGRRQIGDELRHLTLLSLTVEKLHRRRHHPSLGVQLCRAQVAHQRSQRRHVAGVPGRVALKAPYPAVVEIVGERDLARHHGQLCGQVLADLRRVAKGTDPVDALRQARHVHRRQVAGDLLFGDPAREQDPSAQLRASDRAQPLNP